MAEPSAAIAVRFHLSSSPSGSTLIPPLTRSEPSSCALPASKASLLHIGISRYARHGTYVADALPKQQEASGQCVQAQQSTPEQARASTHSKARKTTSCLIFSIKSTASSLPAVSRPSRSLRPCSRHQLSRLSEQARKQKAGYVDF